MASKFRVRKKWFILTSGFLKILACFEAHMSCLWEKTASTKEKRDFSQSLEHHLGGKAGMEGPGMPSAKENADTGDMYLLCRIWWTSRRQQ